MTILVGRLGSIVLSVVVRGGRAGAADLPVATPPPPAFNWSGCYVGGFVGGAWSDGDMTFTDLGNEQFRSYSGGIVAGRLENQHSWNIGSDNRTTAARTRGCNWHTVRSPFVPGH